MKKDTMPRLYLNEYFRRKPDRLHEREDESLFMMEESEQFDVEYVHVDELSKLQSRLEKLKEGLDRYVSEAGVWHEASKKHFSENQQLKKDLQLVYKYAVGDFCNSEDKLAVEEIANKYNLKD